MTRDARAAARLLKVQRQIRQMEEARLGELRRKVESLRQEQVDLVMAMNDDGALQHLFLDTMARRLKALAEPTRQTDVQVVQQGVVVRQEATKEKAVERLAGEREREERTKAAQAELERLLETVVHPQSASFR